MKQRLNRLGYDCEAINDTQVINDVFSDTDVEIILYLL